MRLGLATCSELPAHEHDDTGLHSQLRERGHEVGFPVWDDPQVDWSTFDSVLIRTTWDYQEKLPAFAAWAEHAHTQTRLFNPIQVVRWNTHKGYLRELARLGIPIAPTTWLPRGTRANAADILVERGWHRAFIKPAVGATARETLPFGERDLAAAQAHLDRLLPHEDLMVQPYLSSVETLGELSAVVIDGQLTHTLRKVPVAGDYRVQDDFGATDEPWPLDAKAAAVVDAAIGFMHERFGPLLYARVDLLQLDDGSYGLNELELVEPSLFFRHGPDAVQRLVSAWEARLQQGHQER